MGVGGQPIGGPRAHTPQGNAPQYGYRPGGNPPLAVENYKYKQPDRAPASPKPGPPAIGGVPYEEFQRKRAAEIEALRAGREKDTKEAKDREQARAIAE